jgi:histidinol-phosphate aminotransferase
MHAYVPGEQPRVKGLIKLNTNENPYPPSPKVLRAIRDATDDRLRLYPNPSSLELRERLASLHRCTPENVFVGNGSDELLALATRAFVEPKSRSIGRDRTPHRKSTSTIQYFWPSYSLYPVLADIHGGEKNAVRLGEDYALPSLSELRRTRRWDFGAALTFITTPNAPSGRGYSTSDLKRLCDVMRGVVVLDEAYVDFADENAADLALKCPQVLVFRTFSKAYSLCFQRIGYCLGHAELIAALGKIKDSYNVNGLGQIAALATLGDLPYYRSNFRRIRATRERLGQELTQLGFAVMPSQTNFLLVRPSGPPARAWLEELRRRRLLVRWFATPELEDYLRISVGNDREVDALLKAVKAILAGSPGA